MKGKGLPIFLAVLLGVGALVVAGWIARETEDTQDNPPTSSAPTDPSQPGFAPLLGKWLRPDGGYVIEIRDVGPGGKVVAAYRNPRPIHVSEAGARRRNGKIELFIELRDEGYPGSTYTLTYDPQRDHLAGVYYQAALRQNFDVVFVRIE